MRRIVPYLLFFVLSLIVYSNTFNHDYAWDDVIVITENERVQEGLGDVPALFENIKSQEVQHKIGYRPISLLSFATDVELFGMDPGASHVMNMMYYGLLCCLLFIMLKRFFSERSAWFAFLITVLFLVHPLHVEVVANIKSRDEILAAIFGVVSVLSFLNYLERTKWRVVWIIVCFFSLFLSFMSKENGIVFVGILVLVTFFKSQNLKKTLLQLVVPVAAIVLLLGFRYIIYSEAIFENRDINLLAEGRYLDDKFIGNPIIDAGGLLGRLPNAFYILMQDYKLFIFPITLLHDYGYSYSGIVGWINPLVILSMLIHLAGLYFVFRFWKRKSPVVFGWIFLLISISIFLHLVQVGPDYMGERFLFIPSIGLCIMLIGALEWIPGVDFRQSGKVLLSGMTPKLVFAGVGVLSLLFVSRSINRNEVWFDNQSLLEADLEVAPNCARMQYNYGKLLYKQNQKSPSLRKQNAILKHYQKSVDISTRSLRSMLDLGNAYLEFNQPEKAKEVFEQTVDVYPEMSVPYIHLGKYYLAKEDYQKGLEVFEMGQEKGRENSDTYYMKSVCLMMTQKNRAAYDELLLGMKYNPTNSNYYSLASDFAVYFKDYEESVTYMEKALEIDANNQGFLDKLDQRKDSLKLHQ